MTNGCFDILHPGHISYLENARKLGDRPIVAVNSDDSVKRLKGESRPINNLETVWRYWLVWHPWTGWCLSLKIHHNV